MLQIDMGKNHMSKWEMHIRWICGQGNIKYYTIKKLWRWKRKWISGLLTCRGYARTTWKFHWNVWKKLPAIKYLLEQIWNSIIFLLNYMVNFGVVIVATVGYFQINVKCVTWNLPRLTMKSATQHSSYYVSLYALGQPYINRKKFHIYNHSVYWPAVGK